MPAIRKDKSEALFGELQLLIGNMSQGEIAHATVLLNSSNKFSSSKGVFRLFDFIKKNKTATWVSTKRALGSDGGSRALKKAINRLLLLLSDSITDRVTANRKAHLTAAQQAQLVCHLNLKKIPQLQLRGLSIYLDETIDKTISVARESEIFSSLVQALHIKHMRLLGEGEYDKAEKIATAWEAALNQQKVACQIDAAGVRLSKMIAESANTQKHTMQALDLVIKCQELFKQAPSLHAEYMVLFVKSLWLFSNGFVQDAFEARLRMYSLAQNQRVFSFTSLMWSQTSIADCLVRLIRYDEARTFVERVKRELTTQNGSWWRARELEIELACYEGNWLAAESLVQRMLAKKHNEEWGYFRASIALARGDFFGAFVGFQDLREIAKDKGGWLLGIRLMQCLSRLARQHEETEHAGLALRAWQKRLPKADKEKLRERDVLLLQAVIKMACEPEQGSGGLSADVSPQLEQLRAHPWEPFTYEVFDIAAMLGRIFKQRKWFTAAAPIELFEPLAVYRQAAAEQQAAQPPFKPAV